MRGQRNIQSFLRVLPVSNWLFGSCGSLSSSLFHDCGISHPVSRSGWSLPHDHPLIPHAWATRTHPGLIPNVLFACYNLPSLWEIGNICTSEPPRVGPKSRWGTCCQTERLSDSSWRKVKKGYTDCLLRLEGMVWFAYSTLIVGDCPTDPATHSQRPQGKLLAHMHCHWHTCAQLVARCKPTPSFLMRYRLDPVCPVSYKSTTGHHLYAQVSL